MGQKESEEIEHLLEMYSTFQGEGECDCAFMIKVSSICIFELPSRIGCQGIHPLLLETCAEVSRSLLYRCIPSNTGGNGESRFDDAGWCRGSCVVTLILHKETRGVQAKIRSNLADPSHLVVSVAPFGAFGHFCELSSIC